MFVTSFSRVLQCKGGNVPGWELRGKSPILPVMMGRVIYCHLQLWTEATLPLRFVSPLWGNLCLLSGQQHSKLAAIRAWAPCTWSTASWCYGKERPSTSPCLCHSCLPTRYWKSPPGLVRLRLADFKSAFLQSLWPHFEFNPTFKKTPANPALRSWKW